MAIDTETKRRSVSGSSLKFLVMPPVPDNTISYSDRGHITGFYSGLFIDDFFYLDIINISSHIGIEIDSFAHMINSMEFHDHIGVEIDSFAHMINSMEFHDHVSQVIIAKSME